MDPYKRPDYNDPRLQIGAQEQALAGRAQQGAAAFGQAQQDQRGALDLMAAGARGEAPSQAQAMLGQATDRNIATQLGLLAAGRGGNMAATTAAAGAQGQAMQQAAIGEAAQLRAAEMEAARQAYAAQSNQMAGMGQGQMQAYDMAGLGFLQSNLGAAQQQQQFDRNMEFQQQQANREFGMQIGQAAASAVGGAVMSDERLKTDVEDAGDDVASALDALVPVSWRYKKKRHELHEGRHDGVMAQHLEKSEAGKRIVLDTPEGKAIHGGAGLGFALAGLADINRRLRQVEKGAD